MKFHIHKYSPPPYNRNKSKQIALEVQRNNAYNKKKQIHYNTTPLLDFLTNDTKKKLNMNV